MLVCVVRADAVCRMEGGADAQAGLAGDEAADDGLAACEIEQASGGWDFESAAALDRKSVV